MNAKMKNRVTDVTSTLSRNVGVPLALDAAAGLAKQAAQDVPRFADSIYVNGHLEGDGRVFGYLVHILFQEPGVQRESVTVVDEKTGWFQTHTVVLPAGQLKWNTAKLDINTPAIRWSGDVQHQKISAITPWGRLDLDLEAQGPVLYYGGTGTFELLGCQQFEYALPQMHTTGTLVIEGREIAVQGDTWLDRQWGGLPDMTANARWTWFDIALPGGDKMAIWNVRMLDPNGAENAFATILHPDGTHELVPVTPLAERAEGFHQSPTSEFMFPTRWTISIPTRNTTLNVAATSANQEAPGLGPSAPVFEGAVTYTGSYQGQQVSGRAYVEQAGLWKQ